MSFVGFKRLSSPDELRELLTQQSQRPSYYFLRWAHKVSGIVGYLPPDFPSPEGQMFNSQLELRWKQRGKGYEVLLLSENHPKSELGFTAIPGDWEVCDRNAYFYDIDETQFPKGFTYPNQIPIHQRYFRDAKTSTVHFVALTVKDD